MFMYSFPLRKSFARAVQAFFFLFLCTTLFFHNVFFAFAASMTGEAPRPGMVNSHGTAASDQAGPEEETERPGPIGRLGKRIVQTWEEGEINLIVPLHTWHNRLTYDQAHINKYNENPWGAGAGFSMFDEDGDNHILFVMAFKDSWNKWEPFAGYGFLKNWYLDENRDLRVGLGMELGITARDQYNYIPFPLPLPIAGVGYKQFSIEAAYIPGTWNNGNVLFIWSRLSFD